MKPLSKRMRMFLALVVTVGSQVTTPTAAQTTVRPQFTIRMAEAFPARGLFYPYSEWWAQQVRERTGGRVDVKIIYGGALAGWREALPALRTGLADIAHMPASYFTSEMPLYNIAEMSGITKDYWVGLTATEELMETNPYLMAELKRLGLKAMFGHSLSLQHYGFTAPVRTLEDLKGKTIRSYGGSQLEVEKRLGMKPTFMGYADIYEAMARGTIDGAGFAYSVSDGFKHWEVMKHVLEIGSGVVFAAHRFMRADAWNALPADIQEILIQLRKDWADHYVEGMVKTEAQLRAKWRDSGVTITALTPEMKAKVDAIFPEAQEAFLKTIEAMPRGEKARNVWADYQRITAKYTAEVTKKGYPWQR